MVPLWVKLGWCAGVLLVALARWRAPARVSADNQFPRAAPAQRVSTDTLSAGARATHRLSADNLSARAEATRWLSPDNLARFGLAMLLVYAGTAYALARLAESRAAGRFADAQQVQANPAPANPFAHRLLIVEPDRYRILAEDGAVHEIPRAAPDGIVRAALEDESIRGFVNWMRFPHWTVEEGPDHWVVNLQDLRYQGPDMANSRGIGAVRVNMPKTELRESQ
jgi:hypothetical protein